MHACKVCKKLPILCYIVKFGQIVTHLSVWGGGANWGKVNIFGGKCSPCPHVVPPLSTLYKLYPTMELYRFHIFLQGFNLAVTWLQMYKCKCKYFSLVPLCTLCCLARFYISNFQQYGGVYICERNFDTTNVEEFQKYHIWWGLYYTICFLKRNDLVAQAHDNIKQLKQIVLQIFLFVFYKPVDANIKK